MKTAASALSARKNLSTYLDLLRFTAAMLVVFEHSVLLGILPHIPVLTDLSHESVIVFFVLSGLVIAASSWRPEMTARAYIAARAGRVYSVALPALAVCYGVMAVTGGTSAARFASSFLFLDGVWFNYGSVPFNGPYWSLCYEVWYYAGWGVLLFVPSPRLRLAVAAAVLAVMGPAIAALSGIWLMGAWLALNVEGLVAACRRIPREVQWLLFTLSLIGVLVLASSPLEERVRDLLRRHVYGWWRMRGSEYMVTDYAIAVLLAAHLVAALGVFGDGRKFHESRAGRVIRYCARFTFTLYLFHYPILLAFARANGSAAPSPAVGVGVVAATLALVWLIAFGTERQLPRWRRMIDRGLAALRPGAPAFADRQPETAGSLV